MQEGRSPACTQTCESRGSTPHTGSQDPPGDTLSPVGALSPSMCPAEAAPAQGAGTEPGPALTSGGGRGSGQGFC